MLKGQEITVLGAGIGGLAAATALAQRGAVVRVLEQTDRISEVGAGLQIGPNGIRVLDALGLADEARERATRARGIWLCDGPGGRSVLDLELGGPSPDRAHLLFHRADLVDILAHAARAAGVHIVTGARITHVTPGETSTRIGIDGRGEEEVNFVVGADGLHSVLRPPLNGAQAPFFTGQVAWRALVPATGGERPGVTVHMGPGRHMVSYPLRDGTLVNVVAVEQRQEWAAEGWFHRDTPERLRQAFAGFCPQARSILNRVDEVYLWGLFRHPVAKVWQKGRSALLGDAAHPTLPFMAQGAVMALEDAWMLADCMDRTGLTAGPVLFQARRRPRVTRVIQAANRNARNYHYSNPVLRFAGHNALRLAGRFMPQRMLSRFDWIYGYDVTGI